MYTHQIRLPQTFTGTEQLFAGRSAHDEVLGKVDTADAVKSADERLAGRLVDTTDDRTDKKRSEALLVQG